MKRKTLYRLGALLFLSGIGHLSQAATIFTDRASFDADAGTVAIETFESSPIVGNTSSGAVPSIAFTGFTVSSTPTATKVIDVNPYFGAFNTTPGGKNYLYIDTDVGLQGSTATFVFDHPIYSIGFDYTGFNELGSVFDLTIDGSVYSIAPNQNDSSFGFWGYTSTVSFNTLSLFTSTDSGYGLDQMTYTSPVPVPAALYLFISGLVGLLGFRKSRNN